MKNQHMVAVGILVAVTAWMVIPRGNDSIEESSQTPQRQVAAVSEGGSPAENPNTMTVRARRVSQETYVERIRVRGRTEAFRQWLAAAEQPIERQRDPGPVDDRAEADQFRLGTLRHVSASVSFLNPFQSDDHRLHASLGGGCLLDLGWYAVGAVTLATDRLPTAMQASAVWRSDIPFRVTAMMQFPDDVSATVSCGFDTATRKWFEIAGAEASIVCDDFTRPWPDKPARCWIHEASGKVHSFSFDGNQERLMIAHFVQATRQLEDRISLEGLHEQMQRTQTILDAIDRAIRSGQTETCSPVGTILSDAAAGTETKPSGNGQS